MATFRLPQQKCISIWKSTYSLCDVKTWAIANMLKRNDNKTYLMLVTSKRTKHLHNLPTSITIGNAQIPFKQSLKNFGFSLDCHLAMNAHVSNIARICFFELRRLASIRRFKTNTTTATLSCNHAPSKVIKYNHTFEITSMASCQSKKHIQTSLFVLPLPQQCCTS